MNNGKESYKEKEKLINLDIQLNLFDSALLNQNV